MPNTPSAKDLKPFVQLARQVKGGAEFYERARALTGISASVSEWFAQTYNPNEDRSPAQASEAFVQDVNTGVFDAPESEPPTGP